VGLTWPDLLEGILAGEDLDRDSAHRALSEILDGEVAGEVIAAFLTALRAKGETGPETAGLVDAMLDMVVPVTVDGPLLDTCGTGGDRSGTVNVSTMAALVCAGAGARVAKHGNRASSSQCGSADVLEALGVEITLGPRGVAACIEEAGIGFMVAPAYHPALKHVMPVRRALGIRTIFNVLGPLANPARAQHQLVGVANASLGGLVAETLGRLGTVHAIVAHGHDGLDEVSTTGRNRIWTVRDGAVFEDVLDPTDFGLAPAVLEDLRGGDASTNAAVTRRVLEAEHGPVRDIVLLNAAVALVAGDLVPDVAAGLEAAAMSIDTGAAGERLDRLISVSQREAATAT